MVQPKVKMHVVYMLVPLWPSAALGGSGREYAISAYGEVLCMVVCEDPPHLEAWVGAVAPAGLLLAQY